MEIIYNYIFNYGSPVERATLHEAICIVFVLSSTPRATYLKRKDIFVLHLIFMIINLNLHDHQPKIYIQNAILHLSLLGIVIPKKRTQNKPPHQ